MTVIDTSNGIKSTNEWLVVLGLNPATIGPTNQGPNLRSYNDDDTRFANVDGSIDRSSRNLYKLVLNLNSSRNVITSVARPVNAMYVLSPNSNTFSKLLDTPSDCEPKRKSLAIATQSLPIIATAAPPFIENGSDMGT